MKRKRILKLEWLHSFLLHAKQKRWSNNLIFSTALLAIVNSFLRVPGSLERRDWLWWSPTTKAIAKVNPTVKCYNKNRTKIPSLMLRPPRSTISNWAANAEEAARTRSETSLEDAALVVPGVASNEMKSSSWPPRDFEKGWAWYFDKSS